MAQTRRQDLLIYQKYVDLIEYSYDRLRKYPKNEKFALVVEMRQSMFSTMRLILRANKIYGDKQKRLDLLNEIDAEIQVQKFFVRFSHKERYISNKNYMEWARRLDEIGKILGGWIKATRNG